MITTKKIRINETGRTIKVIGNEGINTTHLYFTAMSWLNDSKHIIVSVENKGKYAIYLYNTEDKTEKLIVEDIRFTSGNVSSDNKYYYYKHSQMFSYDLVTGKQKLVCTIPNVERLYGPVSITNDGCYMTTYWQDNEYWYIAVVETSTGKFEVVHKTMFDEPYNRVGHVMINPVYKNLIFYCHEGLSEKIPDRLWLLNTVTGVSKNLCKQKRMPDGSQGECFGHEMWSFDGEKLYFVKYRQSLIKPTGIRWVSKSGDESGIVNSDFHHWHVSVSPDGKWTLSDIKPEDGKYKIVLTDVKTGNATVLCDVKCLGVHPGHPHPSFSPDSKKVTFTLLDDDGYLKVGYIEI